MTNNVKPIPDGYHTVTPYLIVPEVAKLIDFLTQAFEAKAGHRSTRPDGSIGHAEVTIGDSRVMMGEASAQWKSMPCAIYLYVNDTDATYKRALQAGATSLMEPANQFYGDRNAGVKDSAGNQWWIATHVEDVSPAEMEKRAAEFFKKQQQH
jgi:PhnB protein